MLVVAASAIYGAVKTIGCNVGCHPLLGKWEGQQKLVIGLSAVKKREAEIHTALNNNSARGGVESAAQTWLARLTAPLDRAVVEFVIGRCEQKCEKKRESVSKTTAAKR